MCQAAPLESVMMGKNGYKMEPFHEKLWNKVKLALKQTPKPSFKHNLLNSTPNEITICLETSCIFYSIQVASIHTFHSSPLLNSHSLLNIFDVRKPLGEPAVVNINAIHEAASTPTAANQQSCNTELQQPTELLSPRKPASKPPCYDT